MMRSVSAYLIAAVVLAPIAIGMRLAQQDKVAEEVWRKAQLNGVAPVIVYLACCRQIIDGAVAQQAALERFEQQELAKAQDKLLASLAGTKHRVTARARVFGVPLIGLEVGGDALAVLKRSVLVSRVVSKIPAELQQKARTKGKVAIIVELDVPTTPAWAWREHPELERGEEQAIATAQDRLLTSLAGTTYKILGQWQIIPGIGLEVGADALAVLERSPLVIQVTEDKPLHLA